MLFVCFHTWWRLISLGSFRFYCVFQTQIKTDDALYHLLSVCDFPCSWHYRQTISSFFFSVSTTETGKWPWLGTVVCAFPGFYSHKLWETEVVKSGLFFLFLLTALFETVRTLCTVDLKLQLITETHGLHLKTDLYALSPDQNSACILGNFGIFY